MTLSARPVLKIWLVASLLVLALPRVAGAGLIAISAVGPDAAGIQLGVDTFRLLLGDPNNASNPGPLATGRREINWDGGGATTAAPAPTPFAGFQNTRGALFTTPGTGFLQTPLDAPELAAINPTYATTFDFFSPLRDFTPLGSNITDTTFTIPGSPTTPAFVTGFGVVFSDVDLGTTTLQFFDLNNLLLATLTAPSFDGGLSFIGGFFDAGEQIGRVRITSGNTALGPNDGGMVDVVLMDDFVYSEPQAVPESATVLMLCFGLTTAVAVGRKRKA